MYLLKTKNLKKEGIQRMTIVNVKAKDTYKSADKRGKQ